MRVSTNMIFESNVNALNDRTSSLLKTQQQLSTGKRMLAPSDDPVAAAQVLDLSQALALNGQYQAAQGTATATLGLIDNQLSSVTDLLGRIRELGVQGGNAALSDADRRAISAELRGRFDELLGLANSTDGTGQYLFSGYQGGSKPFAGSVQNGVTYSGDDGQRAVRVSDSRLIPLSVTGNDLFVNIRNGNGTFATSAASANTGNGAIDLGIVMDPTKWNSSANSGSLEVRFWQDPATSSLYYDLVDATSGNSLFTGTASAAGGAGNTYTHAYTNGDAISFSGLASPYDDFGISVTVSGTPASGDAFSVARSSQVSLFSMLSGMIAAIETPGVTGSSGNTALQAQLSSALGNLSQVEDNVLRVHAEIGARLNELEDLASNAKGVEIQYQARVSELQDVDYNKAITDLTRSQTQLQATQQSFVRIAGLSLFNYL